jgi:hypothetical protein
MKRLFIILCILVPIQVNQVFSQYEPNSFLRQNELDAARRTFPKLVYEKVSGSPYYSGGFVNSILILTDGDSTTLPLRYDMFQDEIEFKKDDKILWLIKKDIKYIIYGDEMVVVSTVPDDTSKLGFFFAPSIGKYSLYVKRSVAYRPFVPPKPYGEAIPEHFEDLNDEFYLKTDDMPARVFRTKKVLLGILNDNKAALDFIKKEKIKVDDPEDLQKLFNFLNSQ